MTSRLQRRYAIVVLGLIIVAIILAGSLLLGRNALTHIIQEGVIDHIFATVVLAVVFSVAGIVLLVARNLSRPIKILSDRARRIDRGDYAVDRFIDRSDEIEELGTPVEQMTQDLEPTTVSKSDLDNILRNMLDLLFVIRPDGTIEMVNQATCCKLDYANDELVGSSIAKILPHPGVALGKVEIRQCAASEEGTLITREGREIPVLLSISVLPDEAKRMVCVARDITKRKRAEEALREAKEEAERVNAAKSRFLAAASHDLRQPLQTLSLLTGLLSKKVKEPELRKLIGDQRQALGAMSDLLDTLLDISKLETGAVKPEITEFRIGSLFARIECNFQEQAHAKGLEFRVAPCDAVVRSDAAQLERVIQNLISNAIRYTVAGKVLLGCRRRGECLRIEVWDTGMGIPEGQLKRIFEDFYQLGNPARDRSKGLGLGLAIVDRITHLLGHRIEVRSVVDKGSVFAVEVPKGAAPYGLGKVSQRKPVEDRDTQLSGVSVLLVEDDANVLGASHYFLESLDFQVNTATTCSEALKRLHAVPPDIIITDYRLPGGETGEQMIRRIRNAAGRDIPAIIITGDTTPLQLGAAGSIDCEVLHKPVDLDKLTTLIEELLTSRTANGSIRGTRS